MPQPADAPAWWRNAVVYQVYLRSFRDASGDGIGDLAGLVEGLDYLVDLGVDALWLNPCYASPQRDHGYDIADYLTVDPVYGTNADLGGLVAEAHRRGIRILMDMVANHCSSEHAWFQEALAAPPGSPARARFLFREGRGPDGALPPNNWQSVFGGAAWTRVIEANGEPGQWYFHAFDPGQPDFNWRDGEVRTYFERILRHWFDLGVDGFRIDVAHGLFKAAEMADWPGADDGTGGHNYAMWDQPEVHEVYRDWRAIADSYPVPKFFVGEIWVPSPERQADYLRQEELHQAFSFDLLVQPWDAGRIRAAIDTGMRQAEAGGEPPAWVLANHDVHRAVTRYGQEQVLDLPPLTDMIAAARRRGDADVAVGQRRAKAAAALLLALPGTAYVYQGEELGLPEVLDLPDEARQDPIWLRSDGAELGRDGCRVPLPWRHDEPAFGFSDGRPSRPWLPQPDWFADFAVDVQRDRSVLAVYRELIATRAALFGEAAGFEWLPADRDLVAFRRGDAVCVLNLGGAPVSLAGMPMLGGRVLTTATDPGDDDRVVAPDSASWYRLASSFVPAGADESPEPSSARRTTAIHRRASVTR